MARKGKGVMTAAIVIFLAFGASICLAGCTGKNYRVDYDGRKELYKGAKDFYRAGKEVKLYCRMPVTDTNCSFYLDGEAVNCDYDEKEGCIIRFIMPEHDVKLECRDSESAVYSSPQWGGEADVMLLSCYRAAVSSVEGDGYHELVLTTTGNPEEIRLDEYIKAEDAEEIRTTFYISWQAAQEILLQIEEYGLSGWNDLEDGVSIDGAEKVCRFWDGERYIRVSSDCMPEDGEEKLDTLFDMVKSCAQ
ncbi:MAG: hypothetical protein IKA10_02665 [Oscillospiraceae bacterium]|nr:hypothetical protein [Oscillospiraceae bacterium]